MKTAISIPDKIFEEAEHLARRMNKSRSQLFSNAIEEYVDRHSPNHETEAINNAWSEVNAKTDSFVSEASHRILENSEW
jgi:metal-responsive CopG/Arc/MetJ family transcriptional regulator